MIALFAAVAVGLFAGMFGTVLVLVAVDARRYGYRRVPLAAGARRGLRPAVFRSVERPAGTELERRS